MLGPTLGALIASTLGCRLFQIEGDSKYVIGAILKEYLVTDLFLYNCTELIFDLLSSTRNCWFTARWIPRDQNETCDALAKYAVST